VLFQLFLIARYSVYCSGGTDCIDEHKCTNNSSKYLFLCDEVDSFGSNNSVFRSEDKTCICVFHLYLLFYLAYLPDCFAASITLSYLATRWNSNSSEHHEFYCLAKVNRFSLNFQQESISEVILCTENCCFHHIQGQTKLSL